VRSRPVGPHGTLRDFARQLDHLRDEVGARIDAVASLGAAATTRASPTAGPTATSTSTISDSLAPASIARSTVARSEVVAAPSARRPHWPGYSHADPHEGIETTQQGKRESPHEQLQRRRHA